MAESKQAVIAVPWMALFTFVLAVLKLTGHIALSWWWVFAPMWVPVAVVLPLVLLVFAVGFLAVVATGK